MAEKPRRPRDLNQLAKRIVDLTTGDAKTDRLWLTILLVIILALLFM